MDGDALATRSGYTGRMPRRRRTPARLAVAVAVSGTALGALGTPARAEPTAIPASSGASSGAAIDAVASPPPLRRHHDAPVEVQIIDLTDGPEPDPQALAIGVSGGVAGLRTRGSSGVTAAADFSFTFDVGLGAGGARVPWSLQAFASFAITRATLSSDVQVFPDRWTEIGVRAVYRGAPGSGLLDGRWLSLGLGGVWTSWGSCGQGSDLVVMDPINGPVCTSRHELAPAGLIDVGVGVQEWSTRFARYGFGVRAPFELSSHWGWGAVAFFYAQLGFGR